jgi:hypothetical protein
MAKILTIVRHVQSRRRVDLLEYLLLYPLMLWVASAYFTVAVPYDGVDYLYGGDALLRGSLHDYPSNRHPGYPFFLGLVTTVSNNLKFVVGAQLLILVLSWRYFTISVLSSNVLLPRPTRFLAAGGLLIYFIFQGGYHLSVLQQSLLTSLLLIHCGLLIQQSNLKHKLGPRNYFLSGILCFLNPLMIVVVISQLSFQGLMRMIRARELVATLIVCVVPLVTFNFLLSQSANRDSQKESSSIQSTETVQRPNQFWWFMIEGTYSRIRSNPARYLEEFVDNVFVAAGSPIRNIGIRWDTNGYDKSPRDAYFSIGPQTIPDLTCWFQPDPGAYSDKLGGKFSESIRSTCEIAPNSVSTFTRSVVRPLSKSVHNFVVIASLGCIVLALVRRSLGAHIVHILLGIGSTLSAYGLLVDGEDPVSLARYGSICIPLFYFLAILLPNYVKRQVN